MCTPTRRLQILLDDEQHRRVHEVARARGVAVAVVIREAIDRGLQIGDDRRLAAAQRLARAEPMEVPESVTDLLAELDDLRGRRG